MRSSYLKNIGLLTSAGVHVGRGSVTARPSGGGTLSLLTERTVEHTDFHRIFSGLKRQGRNSKDQIPNSDFERKEEPHIMQTIPMVGTPWAKTTNLRFIDRPEQTDVEPAFWHHTVLRVWITQTQVKLGVKGRSQR